METVYTVSESDGSVEVCVNLTRPQVDIFDEFVVVEVTDFPSSVYIPADGPLASEPLYALEMKSTWQCITRAHKIMMHVCIS